MDPIHEAKIHGLEMNCACGGKSYIVELLTYLPPGEDKPQRTLSQMNLLRVCTSCGRGANPEDTDEAWEERKTDSTTVAVSDYQPQGSEWQIDFVKV